jgi:hypothetical protein
MDFQPTSHSADEFNMNINPTPYPDLNALRQELVDSEQAILGDELVGAYLQGSFAVGDFDRHSDVDFIMVVRDELPGEQVEALQVMHARIFAQDCIWAKHLEGSYFPQAVLRQHADRSQELWYLDNGHNYMVRSTHCNTVVVRWTLRQYGVAMVGPAPATLVDPIPIATLRQEIQETMREWGSEILAAPEKYNNRFYQSFIVLSYCRMLHSLSIGDVGSKRAGSEWAKANLDPAWADLIDRTWDGRPNPEVSVRTPADAEDFKRTLEFVRYCIGESEKREARAE